ncbi:hypothetical protein ACVW19_005197 [Streptomyces sp. TE5632]
MGGRPSSPRAPPGGTPSLLSDDDEDFVVQTATTRPTKLGQPVTRWSIRKLAAYLRRVHGGGGREALRCLLMRRGIVFQRTKAWKESPDTERDTKLDRIEEVLDRFPDRVFAFDEFGPLGIRPTAGSCWAKQGRPDRLPATYRRTHGVTYFHGCYPVGDDRLWGVNRRRKGTANTLASLKSIRAARPDGAPIYIILDNLSAPPARTSGAGRRGTRSSCASPRPTLPGPTRARPASARCGSSPWSTPTTPTTRCKLGSCTATCAGATLTLVTPTCWPPNARNAPASAARRASAGADAPSALQLEQPARRSAWSHTHAVAQLLSPDVPEGVLVGNGLGVKHLESFQQRFSERVGGLLGQVHGLVVTQTVTGPLVCSGLGSGLLISAVEGDERLNVGVHQLGSTAFRQTPQRAVITPQSERAQPWVDRDQGIPRTSDRAFRKRGGLPHPGVRAVRTSGQE